jgi:putative ABC transport system permease protein
VSVNPGRIAVLRWASRLFRREWSQQLLVLSLLTIAIAAAVGGATVVINAASDPVGEFGDAKAIITLDGSDAAAAATGIDAARERFGAVDVIAHSSVALPGSVERLDVRDQDPDGVYSGPMLALRDGRYPSSTGEAALTPDVAEVFAATIGTSIRLGRDEVTVVGIVDNPGKLSDEFALVAPGTLRSPTTYALLVDPGGQRGGLPPSTVSGQVGFHLSGYGSDTAAVTAAVLSVTTLAMALVGLIAAAAFVVAAQRRQRQLGLLSAIGASDRHVRLVMIGNGVIVGAVAAVIGGALGVGGWLLGAPAVERAADHRIGRFDLPWPQIAAILGLGVVVATLAAWWPARTSSRLPVMSALSGRPARPRPVHRSLLLAAGLVAAGVLAIYQAHPRHEHVQPLLLMAGLLAVVLGGVLAAPAVVRSLGVLARRLPFAPRLALRDLARYQARASAALAAITFGLAISVGIVGIASASEYPSNEGNLSSSELLVLVGESATSADPAHTGANDAALDDAAASVVAAVGDGATSDPLDVAMPTPRAGDANAALPVDLGRAIDEHTIEGLGLAYVATPELLARYGIDPATIDDATELLTSRDDRALILSDPTAGRDGAMTPAVTQRVDLPTFTSAPSALITESAMTRHGWRPVRAGWIVEAPKPLSAAQIRAARAAAAEAGLAIEVRDRQDGISSLRTGATIVGGLLAIAIVAMAVGLIRSEATRDIRTLTATGAGARTRRALTATTAGALAVLGVVLGITEAYLVLITVFRSELDLLVPLPLSDLLALAVGLPLAATIAGWLLAGREPRSFSRQALD